MNNIEQIWRKLIKQCLTHGQWVTKDDGDEILELIDNHEFIPNITNSGVNINYNNFLKFVSKGAFNISGYPIADEALSSYVEQLDDIKQIDIKANGFVYTYPERLFNAKQVTRDNRIINCNQVETIVERLKNHKGSNRAVANLYICSQDKEEQHIPCLQFVGAFIRENKLCLHVLFRSNDLYSAFPSNMMFLQYLGLKICDELKETYPSLEFEGLYYNSVSLHIYRGDYEQAKNLLREV